MTDWGAIQVRGARENNLRDVSLDIPKRKLTVFTGVSGSGKSSLVFETIAAESERLINETYPAFVQGFMGTPPRPEVDSLDNLTAAIIVDQERMGANARSTVGTATDAHAMLRIVFSRLGQPHVGPASAFSFNMPAGTVSGEMVLERGSGGQREEVVERISGGMCAECEGLGRVSTVNVDELVDRDKSLNEGAITFPGFQPGTWYHRIFADSGFFDADKPVRDFTDAETGAPPLRARDEGQDREHQPHVHRARRQDPPRVSRQGPRRAPAGRPARRRTDLDVGRLPVLRRHPPQRAGPVIADRRPQHRRPRRDAGQRPRGLPARHRRRRVSARSSRRSWTCSTRWSTSASAT